MTALKAIQPTDVRSRLLTVSMFRDASSGLRGALELLAARHVKMTHEDTSAGPCLRGDTEHGAQLLDASSHECLAGPNVSLQGALDAARRHGASTIWEDSVDNRGRLLGKPLRLCKASRLTARVATTNSAPRREPRRQGKGLGWTVPSTIGEIALSGHHHLWSALLRQPQDQRQPGVRRSESRR
jgi:hypothetical protein